MKRRQIPLFVACAIAGFVAGRLLIASADEAAAQPWPQLAGPYGDYRTPPLPAGKFLLGPLVFEALAADPSPARPPVPSTDTPYGAAGFLPTPQRPIGFRGDGGGWYPGACPPVEWWEGTPKLTSMRFARNEGHFDRDCKKQPAWICGDARSKNILWKAPMPGWGDSQPIVVGERLIALCDPHFVLCFDAQTGKVLWQDALELMPLPVLGEDRKTIGAAPDAALAKKQQTVWELARALRVLAGGIGRPTGPEVKFSESDKESPQFPTDNAKESRAGRQALLAKVTARLGEWRKMVQQCDPRPEFLAALDASIEGARKYADSDSEDAREIVGKFPEFVAKAYQAPTLFSVWLGFLGSTFSTPVSDGHLVVVCTGDGQVAAYEVASGKRLWAWRDPLYNRYRGVEHGPSPLLWKDLAIVRSVDGHAVMGLEKRTGRVVWETKITPTKARRGASLGHGPYMSHILMDVPDDKGRSRTVLVTNAEPVLDPATGAVLGQVELDERSDRGILVARGSVLYLGFGYDGPPSPTFAFRLGLDAAGKLATTKLFSLNSVKGPFPDTPVLITDRMMGDAGRLFDPATGMDLSEPGGPSGESCSPVLAGSLLIARDRFNSFNRVREDFQCLVPFWVLDARDPAHPHVLSSRNLLGGPDLPADYSFDTYLKGFDKKRSVGCYKGIGPWFGCRVGGVVPHGERLYIQSTTAMYCIGPALKGTPQDDPRVVATIRGAKKAEEVAKYLADPSAQYRYEAVRALVKLGAEPCGDELKKLVIDEPYEEIRAAAIEALDAADPTGRPGWTTLLAELKAAEAGYHWWEQDTVCRFRAVVLTLRAMGEQGIEAMAREAATTRDRQTLSGLFHAAAELGARNEAMVRRAVEVATGKREKKSPDPRTAIAYLGAVAFKDPKVLSALREKAGTFGEAESGVIDILGANLPPADRKAYLAETTRMVFGTGWIRPALCKAWRRQGPEALLELKKLAAERPDWAKELKVLIRQIEDRQND
jgi:hypothetical protein